MMLRDTVSPITSGCFFVRSDTLDTSSTSSALVMLPLVMVRSSDPFALSAISKVIPERRRAGPFAFLIRFPIGAEFVRLERANRQTDLPLRRCELDDLHRIALAHGELDLAFLARVVRIVELGHVNEPF